MTPIGQLKHDTYKYKDPLLVSSNMTPIGQLKHDAYEYEDRYWSAQT